MALGSSHKKRRKKKEKKEKRKKKETKHQNSKWPYYGGPGNGQINCAPLSKPPTVE